MFYLSGSPDSILKLHIIWVDILIITAGGATVHDELRHLSLA